MPIGSVILRPGVNVEFTPALNEAGISESQLVRTKAGLTQVVGGWQQYGVTIPSTVRDLHPWQDARGNKYIGVGGLTVLAALTSVGYQDITPQTRSSSATPDVSIVIGSNVVTITDPNSGLSVFDSVQFHTPISIGNLLLQGAYPVEAVTSTGSYTITSSIAASTTIVSSGVLPIFTATEDNPFILVEQPNHTAQAIIGQQITFEHDTTVGGITIEGAYNVGSVIDSTSYTIVSADIPSTSGTATMNNGVAHYHYYITLGPQATGGGYGSGGYGDEGYGSGVATIGEPGTPITVEDWSQDNWGEILISCEQDGPVFQWSPNIGSENAQLIPEAPLKNGGCFISMPQQILVLWKSTQSTGTQDNLIVRWSDAQDFTNYDVSQLTVAGSFHIPTGSIIRGGLQAAIYGVIWTDVDVWIMQFVGADVAFNFTRVGSGCGLIGQHAAGVLAGDVFWCGEENFFVLRGDGVSVIPCTVWDFFFQGMNRDMKHKIHCAPNSAFNEIGWFFCYGNATENDAYVKFNLVENAWDYGFLSRTAWADVSIVGNPIGADTGSIIWQHEESNTITGAGISYFKTGWWSINDGNELAFVDFVMPDMKWATYGSTTPGSVQITFYSADYPGDTPRSYGPYTVTQSNQYITPRIRGRLMSMQVQSASNNVFWRLGRVRYRYAPAGRR